jgi:hypothetical protein
MSPCCIASIVTENPCAAGEWLEQFSFKSSGLLVAEGVDGDAEGPDATTRDELIWLAAYGDPIWSEEIRVKRRRKEKRCRRSVS